MARPREFDPDRALGEIAQVFWRNGFEATSIADLEEATGLARARLYGPFGSKREMLYRAMDAYIDGPLEAVFQRVDSGGLESICGWFRAIAQLRHDDPEKATMGCLVVNSLVEFGNGDDGVNERGQRYRARVREAFVSALEAGQTAGEVKGDIDQRAEVAFMLLLGIFVSVRTGVPADVIADQAEAAIAVVEGWRV